MLNQELNKLRVQHQKTIERVTSFKLSAVHLVTTLDTYFTLW